MLSEERYAEARSVPDHATLIINPFLISHKLSKSILFSLVLFLLAGQIWENLRRERENLLNSPLLNSHCWETVLENLHFVHSWSQLGRLKVLSDLVQRSGSELKLTRVEYSINVYCTIKHACRSALILCISGSNSALQNCGVTLKKRKNTL